MSRNWSLISCIPTGIDNSSNTPSRIVPSTRYSLTSGRTADELTALTVTSTRSPGGISTSQLVDKDRSTCNAAVSAIVISSRLVCIASVASCDSACTSISIVSVATTSSGTTPLTTTPSVSSGSNKMDSLISGSSVSTSPLPLVSITNWRFCKSRLSAIPFSAKSVYRSSTLPALRRKWANWTISPGLLLRDWEAVNSKRLTCETRSREVLDSTSTVSPLLLSM